MHVMNKMYPVITTLYTSIWSSSLHEDILVELLRLSMENVSERIQLFLLMELLESFQAKKLTTDYCLPTYRVIYTIANFIKHRQPHPIAQLYGKSLINQFNSFTPFPQTDQLFHVARLKGYAYPRVNEFVFEGAIIFAWDRGTNILYWLVGGGPRAQLIKRLVTDIQNVTLYMNADMLTIEMNIGGKFKLNIFSRSRFALEEQWIEFDLKLPVDNRLVFMFKLDEVMTMLKCEAEWDKLKRRVADPSSAPRRQSFIGE